MSFWHVYPTDDIIDHNIEDGSDCECLPSVQIMENGDLMVVHNKLNEEPYSIEGTKLLQE